MIHYKIKAPGVGHQWEASSFEEAKLVAGKVWTATGLDSIYIDEYYNTEPTGIWYRKEGMNYIKNVPEMAVA